jgi:hypothetical protein
MFQHECIHFWWKLDYLFSHDLKHHWSFFHNLMYYFPCIFSLSLRLHILTNPVQEFLTVQLFPKTLVTSFHDIPKVFCNIVSFNNWEKKLNLSIAILNQILKQAWLYILSKASWVFTFTSYYFFYSWECTTWPTRYVTHSFCFRS